MTTDLCMLKGRYSTNQRGPNLFIEFIVVNWRVLFGPFIQHFDGIFLENDHLKTKILNFIYQKSLLSEFVHKHNCGPHCQVDKKYHSDPSEWAFVKLELRGSAPQNLCAECKWSASAHLPILPLFLLPINNSGFKCKIKLSYFFTNSCSSGNLPSPWTSCILRIRCFLFMVF